MTDYVSGPQVESKRQEVLTLLTREHTATYAIYEEFLSRLSAKTQEDYDQHFRESLKVYEWLLDESRWAEFPPLSQESPWPSPHERRLHARQTLIELVEAQISSLRTVS